MEEYIKKTTKLFENYLDKMQEQVAEVIYDEDETPVEKYASVIKLMAVATDEAINELTRYKMKYGVR